MSRDEVKRIIQIMCATYPNWKPADLSSTVDAWHLMLEDYPYNQIAIALKAYVTSDASGFAPSVGQLIGKLNTITTTNEPSELEAWSMVSKALRNGYYGAEEEFSKLPELVQKAVGNPSNLRQWSQTDIDSIENVIQSNFLRTYRNVVKRAEEVQKMPSDVKALMQANDIKLLG
jgi:hypothetical protein